MNDRFYGSLTLEEYEEYFNQLSVIDYIIRLCCNHTFENTVDILRDMKFDNTKIENFIEYLHTMSCYCDCDVLTNVNIKVTIQRVLCLYYHLHNKIWQLAAKQQIQSMA